MSITIIVGALFLGALISFIISYLLPKEKIRTINQEIAKQEQETELRLKDLEKNYIEKQAILDREYIELKNKYKTELEEKYKEINNARTAWELEKNQKIISLNQEENNYKLQISKIEKEKSLILTEINEKQQQIKALQANANIIEEETIDKASIEVEQKMKELYKRYERLESELQLHYTDLADQSYDNFLKRDEELDNLILEKQNKLSELSAKATAAAEANKRLELEKQQKDFYRLQLLPIDLDEIQKIKSIEPYLRKKEPLNKVIWKVYYEKPCSDLIGRVVGPLHKTGIYKITNIENGMCYVGQAVDIAERWKQHIKRGIGADPPTQNKLYPAMLSIGVENFTFEIIEECLPAQLNEREDYWQNFYHAKDFGYSIK